MSEKSYVTRLRKAKCTMGTMENYLNVKKDHGIIWEKGCDPGDACNDKQPFMNANDIVPDENIVHFGRCNSNQNPGNKFDLEEIVMGSLIPASLVLKKLTGCSGCKCRPMTFECWENADEKHMVEGAPSLTDDSVLMCRYGGCITICEEEQKGEQ